MSILRNYLDSLDKLSMRILFLGETYRADAKTWITGIEKVSGFKIVTAEIPTVNFKPIRVIQSIYFVLYLLWGNLTKVKYDLVLSERSTSYGFFTLFVSAKIRIVAQQGISDIYPNTFISRGYKKILQRITYKHVDFVHSWGNAMVPAMLKSGLNPIKILVLPKGIDFSKFYFTDHFISGMPNELTAIVTRSLSKDYDHHVIIKAVDILKKSGIRLKLIIIGDGPLNDHLQYLTKKLNIVDQINFIGRIDNGELPHYLSQSHLYLSTPVTEGASSSLMEAMAAGCFPIVTNLPGNKSFIENGKNGILVEVGSPKSLADAILSLNDKFCKKAVIYNRLYAEQKMNREKNMQIFWTKYISLLKNKIVE